ncbi:AsmA-like C-terminal region-containing protein [Sediminibacterium sp.]|uniref:AsmA-like C-terminal region-containing protein n=2 Tax=Sediminibacterium sp. TaxID=1917865 RepID=UPI0025DDC8E3|nr:AsmA-like C-terminal region-containing protein [Sediminibacterium sp.]MBT9485538.1 hypothetical protein [Sediminibacterium sp.]
MKRFLKWLLYGVSSIMILILLLFFVASIYVQQNKKKLIEDARKSIEVKYNSLVSINDIQLSLFEQFPNLSIQLKDVDVKGPKYNLHHQKLFLAKNISIRIKTWPLVLGRVVFNKTKLTNGQLFIYTDKDGKRNIDEVKAKQNKSSNSFPEKIELNNFTIRIKDDQKLKDFHFLIHSLNIKTNETKSKILFNVKNKIAIKALIFNHQKGSFLRDQLLEGDYIVDYNKIEKIISVNKIDITISKIPFEITGQFDLKKNGLFYLNIITNNIPFQSAKSILTNNINRVLKEITITKPININAIIKGPLSGGEPTVIANWKVTNTNIGNSQIQFTSANIAGTFNNQVNKNLAPHDTNSSINLSKLIGNWHQIPIETNNIQISNLTNPLLKGGFKTEFNLAALNPPLNTENIVIKKGYGKFNIYFEGPLTNITENNTRLKGSLEINNGEIFIKPIKKIITNTFADILINNNTVEIKKLTTKTKEGSQLNITGISTNSLAAIPNSPGKANIILNISSPFLDLNNFSSSIQQDVPRFKKSGKNTFSRIDHILENETIRINLTAKSIKWQKLIANNLKSTIELNTGNWQLKNLEMNLGKGTIVLSTKMITTNNRKFLSAKYQVNRVKAEDLFYGMNSFSLPGISHKNIRGELTINGLLTTKLNQQGGIEPSNIKASVNFQLKQGRLLNYEPLLKLQEHIFKKRNLDSLYFATIQNNLSIEKGNIHIPRMEIATSALNLFIGGDYGLDGKTKLHIQVPLNNMIKRNQSKKMNSSSNDNKGGTSLFFKALSDKTGKVTIKIDPKGSQYKKEQIAH